MLSQFNKFINQTVQKNQLPDWSQEQSNHYYDYEDTSQRIDPGDKIAEYNKMLEEMTDQDRLRSIKDDQLKMVDELKADQNVNPTYREIHQSFQLLRQKMPQKNVDDIIAKLYTKLVAVKNPKKEERREERKQDIANYQKSQLEIQAESNVQFNLKAMNQERKTFNNQKFLARDLKFQRRFISDEEQLKYKQKRFVAKSIVNHQYGVAGLEAEIQRSGLDFPLQRGRYSDYATSVVTQAFRRLQRFLIQQCRRNIKELNRYEMSALHSYLCRCRQTMDIEQANVFMKFVKIVYSLGNITVDEVEAVKLYVSLQKALVTKIGNKQLDRISEKKRLGKERRDARKKHFNWKQFYDVWTPQLYEEMVRCYQNVQQVAKVKDYFVKRLPDKKHLFTADSMKGRITKVLRVALKKVIYFADLYKKQIKIQMAPLNGQKVRLLLRCPNSLDVRLMLCDFYFYQECQPQQLYRVVYLINQYLQTKNRQRMNKLIQSTIPSDNVVDKIEHNVTTSNNKLREGVRKYAKEETVLKGQERNYLHFVHVQKGKNLHYFKKDGPDPFLKVHKMHINKFHLDPTKIEADTESVKQLKNNNDNSEPQKKTQNKKLKLAYIMEIGNDGESRYCHSNYDGDSMAQSRRSQSQHSNDGQSQNSESERTQSNNFVPNPLQLRIKEQIQKWMRQTNNMITMDHAGGHITDLSQYE